MTYTEILELIRAGYTKAEIDAMMTGNAQEKAPAPAAPPEDPAPAPKETPEQTPPPGDPAPAPAAPPVESETEKLLKALGMKMDNLVSAVHASNVGGIENPNNTLTPEQVVAQIINPHLNDK